MIDPVMLTRKNLSDLTNSSPHSTCSVLLRIYRLESYYNSSYSGCKSLGPTILLPIQANSKTATSDSQKRPTTLSYNDQSHCSESTPRHRLGRRHGWHSHQASSQQSRDRHTADGESEMSHSRIELQVEGRGICIRITTCHRYLIGNLSAILRQSRCASTAKHAARGERGGVSDMKS